MDASLTRLPQEELQRHVREQCNFLTTSAEAFDRGRVAEAKRLATTLRVLLHTGRYKGKEAPPLLRLLVDLPSQAFPCVNETVPREDAIVDAFHLYAVGGSHLEAITTVSSRTAPFAAWWVEPCDVYQGFTITRQSAVLALANRGGGAHVDPDESTDYRQFAELGALGWQAFTLGDPASAQLDPVLNNPLPAIVRATTAEVLTYLHSAGLAP